MLKIINLRQGTYILTPQNILIGRFTQHTCFVEADATNTAVQYAVPATTAACRARPYIRTYLHPIRVSPKCKTAGEIYQGCRQVIPSGYKTILLFCSLQMRNWCGPSVRQQRYDSKRGKEMPPRQSIRATITSQHAEKNTTRLYVRMYCEDTHYTWAGNPAPQNRLMPILLA